MAEALGRGVEAATAPARSAAPLGALCANAQQPQQGRLRTREQARKNLLRRPTRPGAVRADTASSKDPAPQRQHRRLSYHPPTPAGRSIGHHGRTAPPHRRTPETLLAKSKLRRSQRLAQPWTQIPSRHGPHSARLKMPDVRRQAKTRAAHPRSDLVLAGGARMRIVRFHSLPRGIGVLARRSAMRVCQPGPVARQRLTTSAGKRREMS